MQQKGVGPLLKRIHGGAMIGEVATDNPRVQTVGENKNS